MYNGFVVDDAGTTATQWTPEWAAETDRRRPDPGSQLIHGSRYTVSVSVNTAQQWAHVRTGR